MLNQRKSLFLLCRGEEIFRLRQGYGGQGTPDPIDDSERAFNGETKKPSV